MDCSGPVETCRPVNGLAELTQEIQLDVITYNAAISLCDEAPFFLCIRPAISLGCTQFRFDMKVSRQHVKSQGLGLKKTPHQLQIGCIGLALEARNWMKSFELFQEMRGAGEVRSRSSECSLYPDLPEKKIQKHVLKAERGQLNTSRISLHLLWMELVIETKAMFISGLQGASWARTHAPRRPADYIKGFVWQL